MNKSEEIEMTGAKGNKVLIVEDEPTIVIVCKRILEGKGFRVDTANNGKAAKESVTKQQYDLLLLDIKLPEISGTEFYAWLRKEYPQISRRVIFMTGSVMESQTIALLERSGQPYLLKPFRPADLVSKIEELFKS